MTQWSGVGPSPHLYLVFCVHLQSDAAEGKTDWKYTSKIVFVRAMKT